MKNKKIDFTAGPIGRQILIFSLPMLIGNAIQQLYSVADGIIVGRFVGGAALAAVGVAMTVSNFLIASLIGFTTGASVVISQFFGAKEEDELQRTVSTSAIFLGILSLVLGVGGYLLAPAVLRMLNAGDDIFADALIYLRIMMVGMVFPVFYNMYTAYLRALGDSKTPLWFLIGATLANVVLSVLFVSAFQMGVAGVAIATVISQGLAAVLCFYHTRRNVPILRLGKPEFDQRHFRLILKYGMPAAIQLSFVTLAQLVITGLINSLGTDAIAGIVAATKVDQMAILPISNVSLALSTFVGQNLGASQEKRARQGLWHSFLLMLGLAAAISLLTYFFAAPILSLFLGSGNGQEGQMLGIGVRYLDIMASFYVLFAALFAFNGFLRGVGDAVAAMVMPVISLGIRTVSAYVMVLYFGMGPEALAWSIPIGWALSSLISFFYYKSGRWQGKGAVV